MSISSTTIKVPVSVLLEKAQQLQAYADTNEDVFDRINNSLAALDGNGDWHGVSQATAVNATRNNKQKFSKAIKEMREMATFLQQFANDMAEKDVEIKSQIQSV